MLGVRLEKLEKDLGLLTAMQNLLTSSVDFQTNNNTDSSIQRDGGGGQAAAGRQQPNTTKCGTKLTNEKPTLLRKHNNQLLAQNGSGTNSMAVGATNKLNYPQKDSKNKNRKQESFDQDDESARSNFVETGESYVLSRRYTDEQENVQRLGYELRFEKERRTDLEEASKRVVIKLQRTEDELQRETGIKKALLIETLELKNHIQNYVERVHHLEEELKTSKDEQSAFTPKLQALTVENVQLQEELTKLKTELETNELLKAENEQLKTQLETIQTKLTSVQSSILEEKQTAAQHNQKLQFQVDQLLDKYVLVEKENEKLLQNIAEGSKECKSSETNLRTVQAQLKQLKQSSRQEKELYESELQKSAQNLQRQKTLIASQINSCCSLLSKTKTTLSQLQATKLQLESSLQIQEKENQNLISQLRISNAKLESWKNSEKNNSSQINSIISANMDRILELTAENSNLKAHMKKIQEEKEEFLKLTHAAKNKFLQERSKFQEISQCDRKENENLQTEITRLKDNFSVLQKINQDQHGTIQKLRTEIDQVRAASTNFEQNLAERAKKEQKLVAKLQQEEKSREKLEDQLEFVHSQLSSMELDMERHNCEDQVESEYKAKLLKLERGIRVEKNELNQVVELLRSERDQAIAAGRKSIEFAKRSKLEFETKLLQMKFTTNHELSELEQRRQEEASFQAKKILDLETELEQVRVYSSQTQRTLSNRIQQLQCALTSTTLCLANNNNNGNSSSETGRNNANNSNNNHTGNMTIFGTTNNANANHDNENENNFWESSRNCIKTRTRTNNPFLDY